MSDATCAVSECDRKPIARGWCTKHYQRWSKFGDPLADHSRQRGTCTVDGCESITDSKGLCGKHYQRLRNFGDPLLDRKRPRVPCSVEGCGRKPIARGLCAGHYTRLRSGRGSSTGPLRSYVVTDDIADRMGIYTPLAAARDCWPWTGTTRKGYGVVSIQNSKNRDAHIVAWELHHGVPVPAGMVVRHSCDNPPCVNPAHLLLGTHADNSNDKVERGRQAKGSRHGIAKLAEVDIPIIRQMYHDGVYQRVIAERFGVTQGAIHQVLAGKTWSHVQ